MPADLLPLKPCPFCGGKALCYSAGGADFAATVGCGECNATTDAFEDRTEATEAWNRRTPHVANAPAVTGEAMVQMHPDLVDAIEWLRGPLTESLNDDGAIADAIEVGHLADRLVDLAIPATPPAAPTAQTVVNDGQVQQIVAQPGPQQQGGEGWIACSDLLPEPGRYVEVRGTMYAAGALGVYRPGDDGWPPSWAIGGTSWHASRVTHWRSVNPAAPAAAAPATGTEGPSATVTLAQARVMVRAQADEAERRRTEAFIAANAAAPVAVTDALQAATFAINALMRLSCLLQNDRGTWKVRKPWDDVANMVADVNRTVPIARAAITAAIAAGRA